jgi:molybdopterin synthase sulfur carrier subunit
MSDGRPVRIRYFAWLRERLGIGEEQIELPAGVATVNDLQLWLRQRGPAWDTVFSMSRTVRCAVNQQFAGPDVAVNPGDEVAFFPPVTGG